MSTKHNEERTLSETRFHELVESALSKYAKETEALETHGVRGINFTDLDPLEGYSPSALVRSSGTHQSVRVEHARLNTPLETGLTAEAEEARRIRRSAVDALPTEGMTAGRWLRHGHLGVYLERGEKCRKAPALYLILREAAPLGDCVSPYELETEITDSLHEAGEVRFEASLHSPVLRGAAGSLILILPLLYFICVLAVGSWWSPEVTYSVLLLLGAYLVLCGTVLLPGMLGSELPFSKVFGGLFNAERRYEYLEETLSLLQNPLEGSVSCDCDCFELADVNKRRNRVANRYSATLRGNGDLLPCPSCQRDPHKRRALGCEPHRGDEVLLPLWHCDPADVKRERDYSRMHELEAQYSRGIWVVDPGCENGCGKPRYRGRLCVCGADLDFWHLYPGDYSGSSFTESRMTNTTIRNCALRNASFRGASLEMASFEACDLRGADFGGTLLKDCFFTRCDFRDARGLADVERLGEARFTGCAFDEEALVIAHLRGATIDE